MQKLKALAAAAGVMATLMSSGASAADMLQGRVAYDPGVCANQRLLGAITHRFGHQVRNVPNLPNVAIADFRDLYEVRYQPSEERSPIARRYCAGTAVLSTGEPRQIWYMVEEGQGFASLGDNVEFCVAGFDRWHVYNGHCRVLR